ncbi:MAG: hypothetical protein L6R40_000437 [Gallowayella cf. fulva]|nr:MAG: hypothetical protein L6R40_000437 [Xanthomendoza cf. fulva]
MSLVHTVRLAHLPEDLLIHIALYEDVKNASFLQQQLLDGNTSFEYAFLDASMIVSSTHLLAAVFRAANDRLNGRLKSKNVHSEIVFCLSMNNNIAESFRRFGISPTTASLYAIKVSSSPPIDAASIEQHLAENIEGTPVPFTDLHIAKYTDIAKVHKAYKFSIAAKGNGRANDKGQKERRRQEYEWEMVNGSQGQDEAERKELEIIVLGLMALRGAT